MLEGSKSSAGASPPHAAGAPQYGEKHYFHPFPINKDNLTHGPEHYTQQKNLPPVVSALFQNSALEKSGNACECPRKAIGLLGDCDVFGARPCRGLVFAVDWSTVLLKWTW